MWVFRSCVAILIICVWVNSGFAKDAQKYLEGKIAKGDQRYPTFSAVLELMEQRAVRTIVETGTARNGLNNCAGDGCSTPIFAKWAYDHEAQLYSVDINLQAIEMASEAVKEYKGSVRFITADSVGFLFDFDQPIDFLYLDSYDFEAWNPLPSQMHHLREIMSAYPWLTSQSIVMIDDCDLPSGGKGKLVIDFLEKRGWEILYSGYQVILVKKSSF